MRHPVTPILVCCAVLAALSGCSFYLPVSRTDWRTEVQQNNDRSFRIAVIRGLADGSGEGEFNLRFTREAERLAAEYSCNGFRVLGYTERSVAAGLVSSRIAEGDIECL